MSKKTVQINSCSSWISKELHCFQILNQNSHEQEPSSASYITRKSYPHNTFQRKRSRGLALSNTFQTTVAKIVKASVSGLAVNICSKDRKCPVCMASCLVAALSFARIKVLKKLFKSWKTKSLQAIKSSGRKEKIKRTNKQKKPRSLFKNYLWNSWWS